MKAKEYLKLIQNAGSFEEADKLYWQYQQNENDEVDYYIDKEIGMAYRKWLVKNKEYSK